MTLETIEATFRRVFESGLADSAFTVAWHAGEPTTLGIAYYEAAFAVVRRLTPASLDVRHSFQTNATLLNPRWCRFIQEHRVHVGVSVDGPAFLHDQQRRNRNGSGTHNKVLRGMQLLQHHNIAFHTITVLTRTSLQHPREIFEFLCENGVTQCCFNVEEVEAANCLTSLSARGVEREFKGFLSEFYDLNRQRGGKLSVREFDGAVSAILRWPRARSIFAPGHGQMLDPYRIISVDVDGYFSTYSPELLGEQTADFGKFVFGNVFTDSFREAAQTEKFKVAYRAIRSGVRRCLQTCEYFSVCGGGAPSNKLYENKTFDSSETLFCRLHRKGTIDVVLAKLEAELGISLDSLGSS